MFVCVFDNCTEVFTSTAEVRYETIIWVISGFIALADYMAKVF